MSRCRLERDLTGLDRFKSTFWLLEVTSGVPSCAVQSAEPELSRCCADKDHPQTMPTWHDDAHRSREHRNFRSKIGHSDVLECLVSIMIGLVHGDARSA